MRGDELGVMRFEKVKRLKNHAQMVMELLKTRDMQSHFADLPLNGYLTYRVEKRWDGIHKQPIAMGFLRKVERNLGILDAYITDPSASASERNSSLDSITAALIEYAKKLRMTHLFAFSVYPEILERAKKHGFRENTYQLAVMDLRGKSL